MLFHLYDFSGNFGVGSVFKAKRYMGGTLQTVTEVPFDNELKVITYLMNAYSYQITVDNGVEERTIGNIYTDPSQQEKSIVISGLTFENITTHNFTYTLNMSNGIIYLNYYDPNNETISVEFWVYNASDNSLLFYTNSTNHSIVNFNYIVPDENGYYFATFKVHHSYFGENTFGDSAYFGFGVLPMIFPLFTILTALGGGLPWFVLFFLFPIPLMFNQKHIGIGIIVLVAIAAALSYFGILHISTFILGIGLFIGILISLTQWF
jgi:hypothetical protein